MVMIGIDPHKRTHTAVAVDEHEMSHRSSTRYSRTAFAWLRGRFS